MDNKNQPIGFPSDQKDIPTNTPLPDLKDIWRLMVMLGSLGGLVIAVALGFQLNKYDIYWEQDLGGLFVLLMNYGWLILAAILHLVTNVSLLAWKKQTGLVSTFFLAGWAIISFNLLIQAFAYKTAAISVFPTMQLWWMALGVEVFAWIGLAIGSTNRKRIFIGGLGLVCVASMIFSINLAHRNIDFRQKDAAVRNASTIQWIIDSNDPEKCYYLANSRTKINGIYDNCISSMIAKFHRTDLCSLLQPDTLTSQIQQGNCP